MSDAEINEVSAVIRETMIDINLSPLEFTIPDVSKIISEVLQKRGHLKSNPWNTDMEAAKLHDGPVDLWDKYGNNHTQCKFIKEPDIWVSYQDISQEYVEAWRPSDTGPITVEDGA